MDFNPDKMRARFQTLTKDYDKRMAKLEPLHKKLADHVAKSAKVEQELREQIAEAKEGMYDLEMERAMLARALGGRTGEAQ